MTDHDAHPPLRILIAALGGEGGGVLMNWIVDAARQAGRAVQATSVPGVAQRTGSTSYYIEIAAEGVTAPVLSLVPMPGRVDVLLSSELVETARMMALGYVSPRRTTVISSTARTYSTAEKIDMADGRYAPENVRRAAAGMARQHYLLDLGQLATDNGTFVSATLFGALAGSGVLPWGVAASRAMFGAGRSAAASQAGFDAACAAIERMRAGDAPELTDSPPAPPTPASASAGDLVHLPDDMRAVIGHGRARCVDFQDAAYGEAYMAGVARLSAADLTDHRIANAVTEACRRLALWMAYEDVARVADLKTRPERFARIRNEAQVQPGQILTVTEYMKPRAEEIADILPVRTGAWIMRRVAAGRGLPFLGRGIHLRSNGVLGYRLLRFVAGLRRIRRRSYRFAEEQSAIEIWLSAMETALARDAGFAEALAGLPRVLKGYSDTLVRGRAAYDRILTDIVQPALAAGAEAERAAHLRAAIAAALAADTHAKLDAVLQGGPASAPDPAPMPDPAIPNLKGAANV